MRPGIREVRDFFISTHRSLVSSSAMTSQDNHMYLRSPKECTKFVVLEVAHVEALE